MDNRDLSRDQLRLLAEFSGQNLEEFGLQLPMMTVGKNGTTWRPHKDPAQANIIIEALRKHGWRGKIIWGVHAQDDDLPTTVRLHDMRPLDEEGAAWRGGRKHDVEAHGRGWPLALCRAALKVIEKEELVS